MASGMKTLVERVPALALVAGAAAAWYAARDLAVWSEMDGPGAGLLPKIAIGLVAVFGVIAALRSGPAGGERDAAPAEASASASASEAGGGRSFAAYAAGLAVFAASVAHAGFVLPALAVTAAILRLAEGRSWAVSLLYAFLLVAALVLLFGTALGVPFPDGPAERFLMRVGVI